LELNDLHAIADFYACRGYLQYQIEGYEKPIADLKQGLDYALRANDPLLIADAYAMMGEIHSYFGEAAQALINLKSAAEFYHVAQSDYYISNTQTEIAKTLRRMGDFETADAYFEKLINNFKHDGDVISESYIAIEYAVSYMDQNKFDNALEWLNYSIAIIDKYVEQESPNIDERWDSLAWLYKAEVFGRLGLAEDAEAALSHSLEIDPRALEIIPEPAHISVVRAAIANAKGNYQQALHFADNALTQYIAEDNLRMQALVIEQKVLAHKTAGNYQKAFESLNKFIQTKTEITKIQNTQLSQRLSIEYDLSQKELENKTLTFENQRQQQEINNTARLTKWQTAVIVLGLLLMLMLISRFFFYVKHARLLRSLALTDSLTGLANRRSIETFAEDSFAYAERVGQVVSVVTFDIDHFKNVNDRYGHEIGDKVISQVARVAKQCMRGQDMLARYGGEEYLAVLPGADLEQAELVANRICEGIAQTPINHDGHSIPITVSVGVAQKLNAETKPGTTIRRADTALYDAKNSGRNQVTVDKLEKQ